MAEIAMDRGSHSLYRLRRYEEPLTAWICVLPTILLFSLFRFYPVIYSAILSLTDWDGIAPQKHFVGLGNYVKLFTSPEFYNSFAVTCYYTIVAVPLGMCLALVLGLALNRSIYGLSIYRTLYFMPVVTSTIAVSIIWLWLYEPSYGLVNYFLRMFGLPTPRWLQDPKWAMPALILMSTWKGLGFNMVLFLAGLQGIPNEYYEAARIDGAGAWACFRHITLPLLAPTTFFILVTSIIGSFQVFDQVFIMTSGGPMQATDVVVFNLYRHAFEFFHFGYASAIAYVLFAVILILTLIQWRVMGRSFSTIL